MPLQCSANNKHQLDAKNILAEGTTRLGIQMNCPFDEACMVWLEMGHGLSGINRVWLGMRL